MKFEIKNRWTEKVQFIAEIKCADDAPLGVKVGLAVKWAYLSGADLSRANLSGADLSGAPIIPKIDAAILAAIEAGGTLDMSAWHTCETTHCRAGWAITLAGEAGAKLEAAYGPAVAGSLIYAASRPDRRIPNFYADDEAAMADIVACAAEQNAETPKP